MARRDQLLPSYFPIWNRYVSIYRTAFDRALVLLSREPKTWEKEEEITEFLATILSKVCFDLRPEYPDDKIPVPIWEAPKQPKTQAELTGGKKQKRPDFTCNIYIENADNLEQGEIPLHIECKLLGSPTSRTWVLNKNYVADGIARFDLSSHEYGKRASTGLMIGYLMNMAPIEILSEVNAHLQGIFDHHPPLQFLFGPIVVECIQRFHRKVVEPVDFEMIHIWVDLR